MIAADSPVPSSRGQLQLQLGGLDLMDATMVGFSTGGGEVARYLANYDVSRVSDTMLVSAVTPFQVKTRTIRVVSSSPSSMTSQEPLSMFEQRGKPARVSKLIGTQTIDVFAANDVPGKRI